MSLSGSIEDLPLLEILQIVAFCQKTGHLTVHAPEGEAGVIFSDGRVVSGYIWDTGAPALPPPGSSGRDQLVRDRIALILDRLVRLRQGEFAFNLTDQVPLRLGGRDLSADLLDNGINPEELMLDLARKLDEDRRECAATLEASFSAPAAPEEVFETPRARDAAEPPRRSTVLLVDDEAEICRVVGAQLDQAGYEVVTAGSSAHAGREMLQFALARRPFLLVVDLGLPSESGSSFRAGLDVVRQASGIETPPPVLLMTETVDEKLRARARRLGVSLIAFKPGLSKLEPLQYEADLRAFADKLARDLLPRLEGRRGPARAASGLPTAAPTRDHAARLATLRAALAEIESNPDPDLIAFFLLQAARAFVARAVLLVLKDDHLRGLAGFGPARQEGGLDLVARGLTITLEDSSPFAESVASGRAWSGGLPAAGPLRSFLEEIGPFDAKAAAVIPLRASRQTIAVVYVDAPDGSALPPVDEFIGFVEQAGRALESALMARRTGQLVSC